MTDRPYQHIPDHELADAWVNAFKEMSKDYKRSGALAVVDSIADEIRARGIVRPVERVAGELAEIAKQMRAGYAMPSPMPRIRAELDNELTAFVAGRNDDSRKFSDT